MFGVGIGAQVGGVGANIVNAQVPSIGGVFNFVGAGVGGGVGINGGAGAGANGGMGAGVGINGGGEGGAGGGIGAGVGINDGAGGDANGGAGVGMGLGGGGAGISSQGQGQVGGESGVGVNGNESSGAKAGVGLGGGYGYTDSKGSVVQTGPTFTNAIFPVPSDQVSTQCPSTLTAASTQAWGAPQKCDFNDIGAPNPTCQQIAPPPNIINQIPEFSPYLFWNMQWQQPQYFSQEGSPAPPQGSPWKGPEPGCTPSIVQTTTNIVPMTDACCYAFDGSDRRSCQSDTCYSRDFVGTSGARWFECYEFGSSSVYWTSFVIVLQGREKLLENGMVI
ncbi:uncharacterized protein MYCFIDRAFT_193477 [Pseudocercospora fijiensis CIRAD86]|uniref:Uncharacterized protein n=1 Tax=Pseudocercospora fijiensis (strain CIRAD86) TaxID=383855 RepID=N1QD16_PSEFD|nr:uncharacterized protein MYCFIDRAFT_193477 [Pseudocercospora fijiensis CIRAD86]EME89598.1 hypothetical protein MYCFIDRAFT_193477 [Pseudocercospora fijiensis CIRAD86]